MKTFIIRIATLFAILTALAIAGAFGFMITEEMSFFDAIYFTVITISTVGYGDVTPGTVFGKILAMILVVLGVAIFLGVVAEAAQLLLQRRQEQLRLQRIHILLSLFFSELGNELLNKCVSFDPQKDALREEIMAAFSSKEGSSVKLKRRLKNYDFRIDARKLDLLKTKELLASRGDLVMRLLENSNVQEHESFTELLIATFHLREELLARDTISGLPDADIEHLADDLNRIYPNLSSQWIDYVHYLKNNYPYLYSLAIRTNPFNPAKTVVIEG